MRLNHVVWLFLFFLPYPLYAQPDTTIAGRTYTLMNAVELAHGLGKALPGTRLAYEHLAVRGSLSAATMGLDTVRAGLAFAEVFFLDELNLNQATFLGPVHLTGCDLKGGLSLVRSRFHGELRLQGSRVERHFSAKQALFGAGSDFSDIRFAGLSSFIEAEFTGPARFMRAVFSDAVYFEGARFADRADFVDASFQNAVSFKQARWKQEVSFAGARFADRALFWNARFAGNALFSSSRFAGEVSFNQAAFQGEARFEQVALTQKARFDRAVFFQEATFADSRFGKGADFSFSRFFAPLRLGARFDELLDLRHLSTPLLDLRPPADLPADSLLAPGVALYLQEADYGRLLARWSQLSERLAPQDSASLTDLEPVYAALRHHLRQSGLTVQARACYVEWMERRRLLLPWTRAERWGLQFLYLTSLYGTSLWRLALFSLGCVLVFALLYRWRSGQDPAPSLAQCVNHSLHAFLGSAPGAPESGKRLFWLFQSLLGWLCWALLVAMLVSWLLF
jgi:uncharacterized protein YjbI with pentapeptide repeats